MKPKTVGRVTGGQYRPQHAQNLCYGLPEGISILTARGEIPVENLSAGDRIVTRNGGLVELEDITSHMVATRAVRFTQFCFGTVGPAQDLVLPETQPILVRDWRARALFGQSQAMTTAAALVDEEFIIDIGPRKMTLVRLSFDRPRVVYADGLELGTMGNTTLSTRAVA